jgi:uroporphyrin-III C-methyltransferase/precorrin-2 dehydrogenase/sirohydrochlorin ferrochelatase
MELLPIFLNIRDRKCVVVGGGDIACRKAELLSRAGAEVHVIARSISERLTELSRSQNTTTSEQDFQPACIEGACLVVAATNDRSVNQRVSDTARELGIPVNVVDQPELCSFIMPSIVDRSPIVVAISSTATSPVLTRKNGRICAHSRFVQK